VMATVHAASGTPPRPIRVMHLLYSLGVGGMELGVLKLVQGLDRSVVESRVCSLTPATGAVDDWTACGAVHQLPRREGNDPTLISKLHRVFRRERPDVVHTHAWGTLCEGFAAARLARVPFVVHGEHGTMETRRRNVWVQRKIWHRLDRVLAVSQSLAERMAAAVDFPLDRITVVRNGVDLARFTAGDRDATRARLGIAPGAFVVGTVGRLVPVKDQDMLLTAVAKLRRQGAEATLLLAGDGPLRGELEAAASALEITPHVRFLGARDDVPDLMAAMDVFALTSRSEGMSNTVLEAMASGLPVVATRVGGNAELVRDGVTGLLVPPASPEDTASAFALLHADADRRRDLGRAGRLRADTEFSLTGMMRRYESLYMNLAAGRLAPPPMMASGGGANATSVPAGGQR